ncbi:unnamed protein product, partial [Effrenium voratum]
SASSPPTASSGRLAQDSNPEGGERCFERLLPPEGRTALIIAPILKAVSHASSVHSRRTDARPSDLSLTAAGRAPSACLHLMDARDSQGQRASLRASAVARGDALTSDP